jgi:type VII secretion integral membrane protein EccD
MTARTSPARLPATVGVEVCRLTVKSPERRCDLALPVSAAVGELLPLIVEETAADPEQNGWVLQRLGGPPLDPGATPESLGLHDGDVLYVNPAHDALPEADFDDVSVGAAQVVAARPDQWRSEFTRYLLLGAAGVAATAFCLIALGSRPHWLAPLWLGLAAAVLAGWSVLAVRLFADRITGLACGLGACALGALTGLSARHAAAGLFTLDRRALLLLGVGLAVPALVLPAAARLPLSLFGTVAGWGLAAALGAGIATGLHWDATRTAALLAVAVFATGALDLRIVLRAARLSVPQLPRTAQELQQDIEPEPQAVVSGRAGRAVSLLNILFATAAVLNVVACALLAKQSGWIGWTLALVLCVAVLLRARALTVVWQRAALALSGGAGIAFVAVAQISGAGSAPRVLLLVGLLLVTAALLAASRRVPGRRLLPVWGYSADLLETWTAVALVPLLFQLFHVYSHFRALIG